MVSFLGPTYLVGINVFVLVSLYLILCILIIPFLKDRSLDHSDFLYILILFGTLFLNIVFPIILVLMTPNFICLLNHLGRMLTLVSAAWRTVSATFGCG